MNFLMIIPGLFELLEKVVGPLFESQKTGIISGVMGLASNISSNGIMGVITSVLGKLDDEKIAEIKAGVELALAQAQLNTVEAQSPYFYSWGWRPTLAWICVIGVGINTILIFFIHLLLYALALMDFNPQKLSYASQFIPMVDMGLIGSLLVQMLGLSWQVGVRTFEKNNDLHNKH